MANICIHRTDTRGRGRSAASAWPTRWRPPSRRCAASRSSSRGSRRPRRRPRAPRSRGAQPSKKVAAKNLAVFTRQFSVMIDAGLPLVQCLDILGNQEEDKNFAARHPADPVRRRRRRVAGRRDAQAPEDLRPALHQHGRRGRGGRHPRHDSQAPGHLHREERQAERPGQVGDDLSRSPSSSIAGIVVGVILWKVIPTFASLFAGLGAELPLPTRIVICAEQRPGAVHARSSSSASSPPCYGVPAVLRDRERPARRSTDCC